MVIKNRNKFPIINGFQFVFEENGKYVFQKGDYREGFKVSVLYEEDLKPVKNLYFMLNNELTRDHDPIELAKK